VATIGEFIPFKMKPEDMQLADVQTFHCGSEPHETPLADWIKNESAAQITGGCKVWLYRLDSKDGPLVGYGSYSTGKITTTEPDKSEKEIKMYEIRMLALHKDFWGCPKGVIPEEKYSRRIVHHLQHEVREAQKRGSRQRLLTLYVHPNATHAQDLYLACGFKFAPGRFLVKPEIQPDEAAGILGLHGMDYRW
jgi:hypothetical protein